MVHTVISQHVKTADGWSEHWSSLYNQAFCWATFGPGIHMDASWHHTPKHCCRPSTPPQSSSTQWWQCLLHQDTKFPRSSQIEHPWNFSQSIIRWGLTLDQAWLRPVEVLLWAVMRSLAPGRWQWILWVLSVASGAANAPRNLTMDPLD